MRGIVKRFGDETKRGTGSNRSRGSRRITTVWRGRACAWAVGADQRREPLTCGTAGPAHRIMPHTVRRAARAFRPGLGISLQDATSVRRDMDKLPKCGRELWLDEARVRDRHMVAAIIAKRRAGQPGMGSRETGVLRNDR